MENKPGASSRRGCMLTCSGLLVLVSRLLFVLHAVITVWRLTDVKGFFYWGLLGVLFIYIFEVGWVFVKREAKGWTGFNFAVAIYLLCVVPAVSILRIEQSKSYKKAWACVQTTGSTANCSTDTGAVYLSDFNGVSLPISFDPDTWLNAIDQSLILVLIVVRWIAPFGRVSHSSLSNKLLMYVGIGSDIVELTDLFVEDFTVQSDTFVYWILTVWSVSLINFTLPLTEEEEEEEKTSEDGRSAAKKTSDPSTKKCLHCPFPEVWIILALVVLQDGPFLVLRLFVIVDGGLASYKLVFWSCKNILLLSLHLYQFCAIVWTKCRAKKNAAKVGIETSNGSADDGSVVSDVDTVVPGEELGEALEVQSSRVNSRRPHTNTVSHIPDAACYEDMF